MEWCPACRRMVPVTDRHNESTYEADGEYGYTVTDLDCGHARSSTPTRLSQPAPGAPYAPGAARTYRTALADRYQPDTRQETRP